MNKKIVSIIRPFSLIQEIHIYDNGIETDEINTSLQDFNNTVFNIVNTEDINQIDLFGPRKYLKGLKNELLQIGKTKYQKDNLIINIL